MALHPHLPLQAFGVFSYCALHHFGNTNGFFRLLEAAISNGVYAEWFTSSKSLNDTANFFLAFFWPAIDGKHPGLSLACFAFVGQWVAGWTLIAMEAYRAGNRGRVIS
jgi:hypothetical protein